MNKRTVGALVALTAAVALLALALLVGGAAGDNGHGKRGGHGSSPNGQTGYHFVVLDQVAGTSDRLIIQGDGSFNRNVAHGRGTFDHFRATATPAPLVASGTWKASGPVSFTPLTPTHGVYEGGTLVMHATFFPNGQAPIQNVEITVYCNLGPAGVSTGQGEGVVVKVPGPTPVTFTQTGTGVTIFTLANRDEDDDGD